MNNFETQKKFKYYTKFKAYKLCQSEFSVFKEKEHFTILNREEPMDCNTVTWTQCELLDDSTSYLLKNAPHFSSSFMTTGLENLSIPAKTHHLLLTFITQNNIDKHAEERPIKCFPLTLSLVFHSRPCICPTFCLSTWPILHSGSLSLKFFKVHSSRFTHDRPSQDHHKLGTWSLELQTAQYTISFMQPSKDRWILSPILLTTKAPHTIYEEITQVIIFTSVNYFS